MLRWSSVFGPLSSRTSGIPMQFVDALASARLLGPCFRLGSLKVVFKVITHLRLFQPFNGYITSKRPLFYCVLWGLMGSIKQEPYERNCSPAIGSGKLGICPHTVLVLPRHLILGRE